MTDLALGLGLVLVVEGLAWALAPGAMRRFAESVQEMPLEGLRIAGLASMAAGCLIVWLVRGV